jgi:UDP-glucose 4-epimerase
MKNVESPKKSFFTAVAANVNFRNSMNILVVGAAGFIGSHLVKKLCALGHRVVGVDVDGTRARHVIGKNVPFYSHDFGSQSPMRTVLKTEHIEAVIQCAGGSIVEKAVLDPIAYYTNTVMCSIFFLDMLAKESIEKVIYVSSASVFGGVDRMPITDLTIRAPISPLGHAQLFIENMLESLRVSRGMSYAIARASNVTGLGEIENDYFVKNLGHGLIPDIIRQLTGKIADVRILGTSYDTVDLTAERDYIHIDDFCNACVNILPKLAVRGEGFSYNIGSGRKYSVREVIAIAEKVFDGKIKTTETTARVGDPARLYFDTNKARNDLEWSPKYESLEQILKTMTPCLKVEKK